VGVDPHFVGWALVLLCWGGVVVVGWWATNVDGGGARFIAWALVCCVTWRSRVVLAALRRAVVVESGG
jgi:hypothetical protein